MILAAGFGADAAQFMQAFPKYIGTVWQSFAKIWRGSWYEKQVMSKARPAFVVCFHTN